MTQQQRSLTPQGCTNTNLIDQALDQRLLIYALAAGATLAAATPSKAEVLFTPNSTTLKPPSKLVIDIDHDGVADFLLVVKETFSFSGYQIVGGAKAYGMKFPDQIAVRNSGFAAPLNWGDLIGTRNAFQAAATMATGFGYIGFFDNTQDKFLGVTLIVNGQVHFGWIGFRSVDAKKTVHVSLAGWAYETNPNTPIAAGDMGTATQSNGSVQPTSMELLAAGHTAMEQRRKRIIAAGGH
jgi:hypothetical protein